jgi:hypothetical protein
VLSLAEHITCEGWSPPEYTFWRGTTEEQETDIGKARTRSAVARKEIPLARESQRELARVPRDPARPRVEPGAIPAGATSPEGFEVARKFELRAAARANAISAEPTKWSSALAAVTSLEGKLDAWRAAHPKLAALLDAEGGKV